MAALQSSQSGSNPPSPSDEAVEIVCAKQFHQVLWLPENDLHGRLRVTFSTTRNFSDRSLPVIFFCPPMFGSRWIAIDFDHLANSYGVRMICPDRPGMGGSTPVLLKIRMKVWLEIVSAVLEKLSVTKVSLLCHSAGTVYALNTLYYLRDILDQDAPFAAIIGPWIHNEHSQATLMNVASTLPTNMLDSWHTLNKFINQRIVPAASWSGGIFCAVSGLFSSEPSDSDDLTEKYGTSKEIAKAIEKLKTKFLFEEDTTGADEEAKLCLKKECADSWMACEDYMAYVQTFAEQERNRRLSKSGQFKLKIKVYFAESDIMIGKGGQKYFEECWKQAGISESVDYESLQLPGTNHDSALFDFKKGALKSIFEEVKDRYEPS